MIAGMPEVGLQLNDGSLYKAKGRIETVSGVVDPVTGTVQIKALFPNPDRELLSGSIGNVILQNPKTEAVTIPMTATVELQDKIIAYRLKNGQAEAAYLTVDRLNDGNRFIVKEGLSVGDTIVAEGVGLVREGMSITPKRNEPAIFYRPPGVFGRYLGGDCTVGHDFHVFLAGGTIPRHRTSDHQRIRNLSGSKR